MILKMFRASLCSSSGGQLYIYSIVTLCMLPHSAPIGALQTEWDDTRYCKYTIAPLKMSTAMFETCYGS
jgi:hypothetical protein